MGSWYPPRASNGHCITRSPDSNAETHQVARQPGAVKLMRVRRATAPGSNGPIGKQSCRVHARVSWRRAIRQRSGVATFVPRSDLPFGERSANLQLWV